MLPGLFFQPEDFAHDGFLLYGRVETFARVSLLSHRQILLVFVLVASEDEVGTCIALMRLLCFIVHFFVNYI